MPQTTKSEVVARYIRMDRGANCPMPQDEESPERMAVYADCGFTGTDLHHRPELNRLLADCRAGYVNRILVQSTAQLARRTTDLLEILQELQSLGVAVDFEKERFSTDSPAGKKMLDTLRTMNTSI